MSQDPIPDRTLHSRFEMKYLVKPRLMPAMRKFLRPFVRPDEFAARMEGFTYPICSLYLDSEDLRLMRATLSGIKNRYKLRIRSYSDDPGTAVYCEIKRRMNGIILKRRVRVDRSHVQTILAGRIPQTSELYPGMADPLMEFVEMGRVIRARPRVRVRYDREAYVSSSGDPVRVTFDTSLRGAVTTTGDLGTEAGRWANVNPGGTILEIKFTDNYPGWIGDFVRTFQLERRSVAKYVLCMLRADRHVVRSVPGFGAGWYLEVS